MTKEEILQKWIYNTPLLPLREAVGKAMEEYRQSNSIESLIERNYAAQIRRGQITMKNCLIDFLDKIVEEVEEFKNSYTNDGYFEDIDDKELIDIMLVCFSMAKHFGIDWQQVMKDKVEYNEKRED